MCGICGIASTGRAAEQLQKTIKQMVQVLGHRGPNGQDSRTFLPPTVPRSVALGHTRLAIIDLSEAGRQPISNEDGSLWLVFNGEIYNFQELRKELQQKGHFFRSRTDSEVIVHLYEEHGPSCVERLNGMFAFAVLDLKRQELFLARDPIGIKPLYYYSTSDLFLFGSEIKTILASRLCGVDVNRQAVHDYFTYLYVPCPQTSFQDIWQVPPAHRLTLRLSNGDLHLERYWKVSRLEHVEKASFGNLKVMVRELATDSVRRQLVSDVPLGVFLSGGVDSTIVTGLARQQDTPLHTFTVIFQGKEFASYNEQAASRSVSRHLQTEHVELHVETPDPKEMLNLVEFFDQPFGNPTFYLMYLISKKAREHITVALCGAGGDELYAGYPRYRAVRLAQHLRWIPRSVFRTAGKPLSLLHDSYNTMRLRRARKFLEGMDDDHVRQFVRWTYYFDEAAKARLLPSRAIGGGNPNGLAPSERFLRTALDQSPLADPGNRLLHADVQSFLLDNVLEYTDKMSMAVALEVRVPLLDHRFVELSLNAPFTYKLRNGRSKLLLHQTFSEFFPPSVRGAPKRGFNAPLPQWMRQTLDGYFETSSRRRGGLEELQGDDPGATWREGILDWSFISQLREQHRRGKRDNSYELFAIIMFDVWWRKYVKGSLPMLQWGHPRVS